MTTTEELKDVTSESYKELVAMAQKFYKISESYLSSKREQWKVRKSLYNNQLRKETDIGDPLIFSTIQTILASLYNDKLSSEFKLGNDKGGMRADNLGYCASSDYLAMEKDVMDFFWGWDACFYGKGFKLIYSWNKEELRPTPILLNPLHVIVDPMANSINGLGGRKASRFFGWEELTTKRKLKQHSFYFNLGDDDVLMSDYENSLLNKDKSSRDDASNLSTQKNYDRFCLQGKDEDIVIWEMFIHYNGELIRASFANGGSVLIGFQVVDKKFKNRIPVAERSIYPTDDFFGSSVCDFVEDKQRARAKIQNLALESVEFGVYGMLVVDENKIDIDEVATPYPNKIIRSDGDIGNAVAPIPRQNVQSDVQYILETMKYGAEQATGTPAIQQGMSPDTSRTATELATQRQTVDKRYSLSTKVWGWSEKREWTFYYICLDVYMTSTDTKTVIVQGATGDYDLELSKKDIIGDKEPLILIESQEISEAKRSYELQVQSNLMSQVAQYPSTNLRYGYKKLVKLSGYTEEEASLLLPPTPEEIHAQMENESLSKGIYVEVAITDDHIAHKTEHEACEDNKELQRHLKAHDRAMVMAMRKPELLPAEASTSQQTNQSPEAVAVGAGEASPQMDYGQGFPNKI